VTEPSAFRPVEKIGIQEARVSIPLSFATQLIMFDLCLNENGHESAILLQTLRRPRTGVTPHEATWSWKQGRHHSGLHDMSASAGHAASVASSAGPKFSIARAAWGMLYSYKGVGVGSFARSG